MIVGSGGQAPLMSLLQVLSHILAQADAKTLAAGLEGARKLLLRTCLRITITLGNNICGRLFLN